jgi:hypothetical protein
VRLIGLFHRLWHQQHINRRHQRVFCSFSDMHPEMDRVDRGVPSDPEPASVGASGLSTSSVHFGCPTIYRGGQAGILCPAPMPRPLRPAFAVKKNHSPLTHIRKLSGRLFADLAECLELIDGDIQDMVRQDGNGCIAPVLYFYRSCGLARSVRRSARDMRRAGARLRSVTAFLRKQWLKNLPSR